MRSKLFFIINLLLNVSVWSQKTSNSPLSSFGLGEFGTLDHASYSGFGNISSPICDSLNLNFFNPASYSFLGIGQPVFSTGMSTKFSTFSENGIDEKSSLNGINHFGLGIPFAKIFGLGLGLKPFTRKGYDFYSNDIINSDTITNTYQGSGSTNEAFAGLSIKIVNLKHHKISFGTNLGYIFGTVKDQRMANLTTQEFGAIEEKTHQLKAIYYQLGLNYNWHIKPNQTISIGATYAPAQNLNTFKNTNLIYASDITNENSFLSLSNIYEKGEINFPSEFTSGIGYTIRPKADSSYNKTKIPQVKLLGEWSSMNWSNFSTNFTSDSPYQFENSLRIAIGIEYTPHYNYLDRAKSINYFHKIKYRAGFQYANLPYKINNVSINSQMTTLGLSLPIISQRSVSSINIGFTFGEKGKATSFSEKFVGLNVGVNIAPGTYDRWFRKYKID